MITRRNFVCRSALAASVAALAGPKGLVAGEESGTVKIPIVDTHQHLWDFRRLRPPWLQEGTPLCRSYVMKDYLEATRGLNVVQAVYMEVATAAEDKLVEAEYVLELCRQEDNPTVAAVIGGQPGSEGFRPYISRFKDNPYIKGVRHIPKASPGGTFLYQQRSFVEDIRLLGKWGKRFDLCAPPQRLPAAISVVDQCPETQFIVDHCGNADPKAFWSDKRRSEVPQAGDASHDADAWRRDMGSLAKRSNVVCKISGIVSRAPRESWKAADLAPIVMHCLDVFGPDRVMFAGDWPVCTRVASLRAWVTALQQIVADLSLTDRRKLFAENAIRFYGLEESAEKAPGPAAKS